MLKVGSKVKVIKPYLRETMSKGVILSYDSSTDLFSVVLVREMPPYRGYYSEEELWEVDEDEYE